MKKFMCDGYYKSTHEKKTITPPYGDPDCEGIEVCSYYRELMQFLNQQEEKLNYSTPYEYKKDDRNEKKANDGNETGRIAVYCSDISGKSDLYLKSDQFGFSVGNFDKQYPYGMLYEKAKQENDEKKKEEKLAFIADCIYDTRTLGGGFLWPSDMWEYYNKARGGNARSLDTPRELQFYIEDRVDLTLLEVKHLFEWICEVDEQEKEVIWNKYTGIKIKDKIFFKKIKEDSKKHSAYIKWLRHFGSFENYIKFFCFDDFMVNVIVNGKEDVMPLDIAESELKLSGDGMRVEGEKIIPLKDPTKYKERKENSIYRLCESEMLKMLNNVRILTIARSKKMQDVVDQRRIKR